MSKYFGTDGFRGEANKALNVEHAYKIGRFLGAYYGREHKCSVVIGKDTRRSGYMFECALTGGTDGRAARMRTLCMLQQRRVFRTSRAPMILIAAS